jgi:hypothetical protein
MAVPPNPAPKDGEFCLIGYVGNVGTQDGFDILLHVALHIKNWEGGIFISPG